MVEVQCFADVDAAWHRVRPAGHTLDDARQLIREKLFVGGGGRPKVLDYAARGALRAWMRVVAMRMFLNLATRGPKEDPTEDPLELVLADLVVDPEGELQKHAARDQVRAAFLDAARGLPVRDRNLLRAALVDARSIDDIGALYRVHRATAARWVAAARERLLAEFSRSVELRLGIEPAQVRSIVHLVLSQLEISLDHVFAP